MNLLYDHYGTQILRVKKYTPPPNELTKLTQLTEPTTQHLLDG
jgi:hypothetical protein